MRISDRLEALRAIQGSAKRLSVTRDDVLAIDEFLSNEYGIRDPLSPEECNRLLEKAATTDRDASRLWKATLARSEAHFSGGPTAELDSRFYDLMAVQPYMGWLHSTKRVFILDAAAALTAVIQAAGIDGPILDVGCHAGYHANWIAERFRVPVEGIDTARRAVAFANSVAVRRGLTATFHHAARRTFRSTNRYQMIVSVDGPYWLERFDPTLMSFFQIFLEENGLFVVGGEDHPDMSMLAANAARYGLTPLVSDVTGGWAGSSYSGARLLVFVKLKEVLSIPEAWEKDDAAWTDRFAAYSNSKNTPLREKTQAFFRSL